MLSYCLKCKKKFRKHKSKTFKTTVNGKTMLLSNCAKWGSKKSRFIKIEEPSGLFNSLGLRTPLSKIPLFGNFLF